MRISRINAAEVLDSRGNPTVEASVILDDGTTGSTLVPSGASTGEKEAVELRDDDLSRFGGKGVLGAVSNINDKIGPAIAGTEVTEQRRIDQRMLELDGAPNKSNLGANAILRPGCGCKYRTTEDGVRLPGRASGEVQPALENRKTTGRSGSLRRQSGV